MYSQKVIFSVSCAGMLLFGITLITLGAVLPGLRIRYGLDDQTAGTLFALLPLGILTGSLLFGYLCDRYGYKWILTGACLLIGAGLWSLAAFSSTGALKWGVFIFGLGGGCINGATNALVADISRTHKSANLSLLGVFFAVGALGVPLLLGVLEGKAGFETILLFTALLSAGLAAWMYRVAYPPVKDFSAMPLPAVLKALNSKLILLVAFFLFFQSSLEAIVHNWITSYLTQEKHIIPGKALYALTMNVAGMAVMRLLMGGLLRKAKEANMLLFSMLLLLFSAVLLNQASAYGWILTALTLMGAGMAAGFPVMYAITGRTYARMSATAFSFILVIALLGNMLLNYLMGLIAGKYGMGYVTPFILAEVVLMLGLSVLVIRAEQTSTNNHKF